MSFKEKAIKGIAWFAFKDVTMRIITLITVFFLAHLLDPSQFGLFSLSLVALAFLEIFADQGLEQALVQRKDVEKLHFTTSLWVMLIVNSILILITIASAGMIASAFKEPELEPILRWLSLSFIFFAVQAVPSAILRRQLAFRKIALISTISALISGAVGIFMAFSGFGVWSLVVQRLSNLGINTLLIAVSAKWLPGAGISRKHFMQLFSFGMHIFGFKFLNFFNRQADHLLIGYFIGTTALGYYTIAYRIIALSTALIRNVSTVMFPVFSRIQDDAQALREHYFMSIQLVLVIAFPVFFGISATAPEVVKVFFGINWIPSIPVMQVLSFIGIVHSFNGINMAVISALGKPDWSLKANILNVITNMILFLILVHWGITAIATGFVARGWLLALPLFTWLAYRLIYFEKKQLIHVVLMPFISALIMAIIVILIRSGLNQWFGLGPAIILSITILMGAASYTGSMYILAPELFGKIKETFVSLVVDRRTAR